ncbi:MAG: hypothetical protein JWO10_265 [Microbacteriaceae bacterium]|nr:hypothetical protein [Microbacteriaceae bacterium]
MTDENLTPAGEPAPSATTTPTRAKKTGMQRWITPILALVAALAIGIFGGVLIGHATTSTTNASQTGRFAGGAEGGFGGGATGAGGGFTAGTIVSVDGDTITLKTAAGATVKVKTGSSTTVTTSDTGAVSDLAAGDTIRVVGAADSSGNVTATSVSEGETTGGFGGGRTPPAAQ